MNPNAASQSRTNSTYSEAAIRPRAKRFITGLEEFSAESTTSDTSASAIASPSPPASTVTTSPFFTSRAPSPIPKQHPSRASSLRPPTHRQASTRENLHTGNGELGTALSGLWGKSWTSLQELASNVLGSDASNEVIKDNPQQRSRKAASSRPSSRGQWGPAGREESQPGIGSQQDRSALLRARKREELLAAGVNGVSKNAANFKRRTSDDFGSSSAPPGESDDRDILIYVHHVSPRDTMAGISIKYNCQLVVIKKVNRLWSNDGIQARKTLMIPLDACSVRSVRVAGPEETGRDYLTGSDGQEDRTSGLTAEAEVDNRRNSTSTITQHKLDKRSFPVEDPPSNEPTKSHEENTNPWTHDHWVQLVGQTEKTEIGRLPRSNLGYFPRARRKSGSISSLERSSASLDFPQRPSITVSDTSSGKSTHRTRRSSGSNNFAQQMLGPGGVGSLKGRGPSTPGPSEDKIAKVFKQNIPSSLRLPGPGPALGQGSEDEYFTSTASTPSFGDFGHTVEGWARKFGKGVQKVLEGPPPNAKHMAPRQQRGGFSSTTGGDLIELAQAFEIGEDEEDEPETPKVRNPTRGRRSSFDRLGGSSSHLAVVPPKLSRSKSDNNMRRKGD